MAEFKIDGRMTVRKLKENFKNEFEGTLRVYDGRELADDKATLAAIRKGDAKGGELVCRASRTVGKFEQEMKEVFGIRVQVASPDDWVLALDGITLANLKNIKRNATKADMEELVAYKRKEKEDVEDLYVRNNVCEEDEVAACKSDTHRGNIFNVVLKVGYVEAIEMLKINPDELNIDTVSEEEAAELLDGNHFFTLTDIDIDKEDNDFELKVYDEDDELVYESDNFSVLNFVHDGLWMAPGNEKFEAESWKCRSNTDWHTIKQISEDLWKKEKAELSEGYYIGGFYSHQYYQTYSFTIEDTEFDPKKLVIISNKKVEGLRQEYSSDPNHILYAEKFVAVQLHDSDDPEDEQEEYKEYSVMHRTEDGSWDEYRYICD